MHPEPSLSNSSNSCAAALSYEPTISAPGTAAVSRTGSAASWLFARLSFYCTFGRRFNSDRERESERQQNSHSPANGYRFRTVSGTIEVGPQFRELVKGNPARAVCARIIAQAPW